MQTLFNKKVTELKTAISKQPIPEVNKAALRLVLQEIKEVHENDLQMQQYGHDRITRPEDF